MIPFFGTFVVVSALTFGATLYNMRIARRAAVALEQVQMQITETPNFTDISDAVCDCIALDRCQTLRLVTDQTKYCGDEGDIGKKICCPINFNAEPDVVNFVPENIPDVANPANPENGEGYPEVDPAEFEVQPASASNTEFPPGEDSQDYPTDAANSLASKIVVSRQVISENQVSFKTHKNFQLLPHWKECGISPLNPAGAGTRKARIVGGEKVNAEEFPWITPLGFLHKAEPNDSISIVYKCSGTILNQNYIIGAAHCVSNFGNPVEILAQSTYQNISLKVEKVLVHPSYNKSTKSNDIMLIRIGEIIKTEESENANTEIPEIGATDSNLNLTRDGFEQRLTPICLPFFTEYGVDQTALHKSADYVVGWGVSAWNSTELSDSLKKLTVPTIPNEICNKMFGNYFQVTESQICAGGNVGQDTCQGDSGGPLATTFDSPSLTQGVPIHVQMGITSFGAKICGKGVPGVYTLISHYLQWILDSIEP